MASWISLHTGSTFVLSNVTDRFFPLSTLLHTHTYMLYRAKVKATNHN